MKIEKVNVAGINGSNVNCGHFSNTYDTILQLGSDSIVVGKTYTIHGYIKCSKAATITCLGSSASVTTTWKEIKMIINPTVKTFNVVFTPGEYWIYNWKLEIGSISSLWTPSPLDAKYDLISMGSLVNQMNNSITQKVWSTDIDAAKDEVNTSIATVQQMANKINWIVLSGSDKASMELTSEFYNLVAENINLKGNVFFKSFLDNKTQTKINGGMIETGSITTDQLAANSITADKILIGDMTNYITVSPYVPSTLKQDNYTFSIGTDGNEAYIYNPSKYDYILCDYTPWCFKAGEQIVFDGEIKAKSLTGMIVNTQFCIFLYSDKKEYISSISSDIINYNDIKTDWTSITRVLNIPYNVSSNVKYFRIGFTRSNTAMTIYMKASSSVRRKTSGTLIENGSITTDQIKANSITTKLLATDAIKSINYVEGIAGTYLNLETGTISTKNFNLSSDGTIVASNGSFSGRIISTLGSIGGFIIGSTSLSSTSSVSAGTSSTQYMSGINKYSSNKTIAFYVANRYYNGSTYEDWKYPFYVNYGGEAHASNLMIEGGSISGCKIEVSGTQTYNNKSFTSSDIDILNKLTLGLQGYGIDKLLRYDINGDGALGISDIAAMKKIVNGETREYKRKLIIDPSLSGTIRFYQNDKLTSWYNTGGFYVYNGTMQQLTIFSDNKKGVLSYISDNLTCRTTNGLAIVDTNSATDGFVMHGTTTDHKYYCNWDGSKLNFKVDETWIGNISDRRLKRDISKINEKYLNAVGNVDIIQYKMQDISLYNDDINFGVLAQDLRESFIKNDLLLTGQKILGTLKQSDDIEYYTVDYEQFLIARIAYDEKEIGILKSKLEDVIIQLNNLQNEYYMQAHTIAKQQIALESVN